MDSEKITSDFQWFVCGAIFTTEQGRRQHLEKELAGRMQDDSTEHDIQVAKEQTELGRATGSRTRLYKNK